MPCQLWTNSLKVQTIYRRYSFLDTNGICCGCSSSYIHIYSWKVLFLFTVLIVLLDIFVVKITLIMSKIECNNILQINGTFLLISKSNNEELFWTFTTMRIYICKIELRLFKNGLRMELCGIRYVYFLYALPLY